VINWKNKFTREFEFMEYLETLNLGKLRFNKNTIKLEITNVNNIVKEANNNVFLKIVKEEILKLERFPDENNF
jgi:hypothetical protein